MQFVTDLERIDASVLRVLQRADPTFRRKEMQNETAINDRGFEVDFLRPTLTEAPKFEHADCWRLNKAAGTRFVSAPVLWNAITASMP